MYASIVLSLCSISLFAADYERKQQEQPSLERDAIKHSEQIDSSRSDGEPENTHTQRLEFLKSMPHIAPLITRSVISRPVVPGRVIAMGMDLPMHHVYFQSTQGICIYMPIDNPQQIYDLPFAHNAIQAFNIQTCSLLIRAYREQQTGRFSIDFTRGQYISYPPIPGTSIALAISGDGKRAATATLNPLTLTLWDISRARPHPIAQLTPHQSQDNPLSIEPEKQMTEKEEGVPPLTALLLNGNGSRMLYRFGNQSITVCTFNIQNTPHQHQLQELRIASEINVTPSWDETGSLIAIPTSPRRIEIVSFMHDTDSLIHRINLPTRHSIEHPHPITAFFLHPSGNYLALTGSGDTGKEFTIINLKPEDTLKYLLTVRDQITMLTLWQTAKSYRPEAGPLLLTTNLSRSVRQLPPNIRRAISTSLPHLTVAPPRRCCRCTIL